MSRELPSGISNALEDDVVYPFFAIKLGFDDPNTLRLWTGYGDLTYEGETYTGTGQLLSISNVEETAELAVRGATIVLSGIPSEVISLALSEPYQGRLCNIYFGMFDNGSSTITLGLTEIFAGYMDQMDIEESEETATIELKVENRLIDLERPRVRRFTSSYQKSIYPNDEGLDFVESIQSKEIPWGRKAD